MGPLRHQRLVSRNVGLGPLRHVLHKIQRFRRGSMALRIQVLSIAAADTLVGDYLPLVNMRKLPLRILIPSVAHLGA